MFNKSYLSVYAKSFSWAGFFLPKETLKKCSDLYDFCRVADNIADDDDEIENKSWIVLDNQPNMIFKLNKKNSWNKIIKSLGDKYKIWSNSPDDITLN